MLGVSLFFSSFCPPFQEEGFFSEELELEEGFRRALWSATTGGCSVHSTFIL